MSDQICTCDLSIDNSVCQCSVVSSYTVAVDGSGRTGRPTTLTPILNPDPDNMLTCESDGLLEKLPDDLLVPPQCRVFHSVPQAIADDTNTILAMNSETYDTDGMHSNVTFNERITFQTNGLYLCTLRVAFAANVAGDRWAYIRRNAREIIGGQARKALNTITFDMDFTVTVVEYFAVGEFIHAEVKQDSGGALNINAEPASPILTAKWLRGNPDA